MKLSTLLVTLSTTVLLASAEKVYDGETIAQTVNDAHTTWKATSAHRFTGRPIGELRRLLGYNVEKERMGMKKLGIKYPKVTDTPIPSSFDARQQWSDCAGVIGLAAVNDHRRRTGIIPCSAFIERSCAFSNIRDQSNCGSCWAVAAVGVMSDRLCIASKASIQVSVSANNLISCCWTCGFGCDGGYAFQGWQYFEQVGLVTGGEYDQGTGCQPYPFPECEHHNNKTTYPSCDGMSFDTPQCLRQCQPYYNKQYDDDMYYGTSTYRLPADVEAIQREIMSLGSVETGFTVYADFPSYTSGVYQHTTGAAEGGHAVRIIGWGVEQGTPYWLIANSWNADWGDKGYFKILRGADECGIESGIVAGQVKVPHY